MFCQCKMFLCIIPHVLVTISTVTLCLAEIRRSLHETGAAKPSCCCPSNNYRPQEVSLFMNFGLVGCNCLPFHLTFIYLFLWCVGTMKQSTEEKYLNIRKVLHLGVEFPRCIKLFIYRLLFCCALQDDC
jgi:hypothetical protein